MSSIDNVVPLFKLRW